jgi:iron complex transport system substrate-binding protein
MRIVSLLPSATEIVYALGLGDELVGVSHECDYPSDAKTKPIVSTSSLSPALRSDQVHRSVSEHHHSSHSLYNIDEPLLRKVNPDVILTQELCSVCAVPVSQVREATRILAGPCRIVSLEPNNLQQILDTILAVGEVAGRNAEAHALVAELENRIARVAFTASTAPTRPRVFCMEWMDPPMAGGHWMPEMVRLAGGVDNLGEDGKPSTVIAWQRVVEYAPEIVVIMPCGYKIPRSLAEVDQLAAREGWYDLPAVRESRVYIVDSPAYFSRPGPRIVQGLEILAEIIHPGLFSGLIPREAAVKLNWREGDQKVQGMSERFVTLS